MHIIDTWNFEPKTGLEKYLKFVTNELKISPWLSPEDSVSFIDGTHAYTLHREGQFQVQLYILRPNIIVPDHTHPNVDSFEVAIRGVTFRHSGSVFLTPNRNDLIGRAIYVGHDQWHGGYSSDQGGVFLSVQEWLNGVKPSTVADDWVGDPMGPLHVENISAYESNQS
jgi:hypothetical protein